MYIRGYIYIYIYWFFYGYTVVGVPAVDATMCQLAWICALAPSLGAFSVAAELPVLDGTREVFIENPSMFQIHDDFQNRQVLLFQNFSRKLLPNSLATRRRHVVVLAFTHCFDKQF